MAPSRTQYTEISADNTTAWSLSAIALAFIGTAVVTLASIHTSALWLTPATTQTPVTVTMATTVGSHLGSAVAPSVGAAASSMVSEELQSTAVVEQPQNAASHLPSLLVAAMGLCAAAWAHAVRSRKAPVLDALDLEGGYSMASAAAETETTYHFLVANAKFMLFDEEQAMELLREKRRFLREKNLPQDFWLVPNPEFLDSMPDVDKRVLKPCCALVSTDEKWIRFMKLRYDRVLMGSFKGSTDVTKSLATKGGDPIAVVPKWDVAPEWNKTVPYPHYSNDWFHTFLVGSKSQ